MPDTRGLPPNIVSQRGIKRLFLPTLLIVTVAAIYLPLIQFPFVQDDWAVLHALTFRPASSVLLEAISPGMMLFYRPLGFAYFALVYSLFGLHPIGFHLLSILMLIVSSFLVTHIGKCLTGDARIAWGSGFLFAAAASVHIDTQMWLVGAFDIGSTVSSLLCVALFLHRRYASSALFLAAALAFKESAVTLPLILVVLTFVPNADVPDPTGSLRTFLRRVRFHGLVCLIYAIVKFPGPSLFSLPASAPYAARFSGQGGTGNMLLYGQWVVETVTPIKGLVFSIHGSHIFLASVTAGIAIAYFLIVRHSLKQGVNLQQPTRIALALSMWFLFALLPAAALGNHPNKYYLTIVLPPIAIGMMLFLKALLTPFGKNARIFVAGCALFTFSDIVDGILFIQRKTSLGIREGVHATSWDGDNHLVRKASVVHVTWTSLLSLFPSLPANSVLVFRGVEAECFMLRLGPQVWYRDSTILVGALVPGSNVEQGNILVALPPENPWNVESRPTLIVVAADRVIRLRGNGMMIEREED